MARDIDAFTSTCDLRPTTNSYHPPKIIEAMTITWFDQLVIRRFILVSFVILLCPILLSDLFFQSNLVTKQEAPIINNDVISRTAALDSSQNTGVLSAIISSNSSQYTWLRNQLVPPNNVPIFHPKLYREYFQKRNTLFVGDSLARRAYATINGIISCNNSDIVEIEELVGKDGTLLGQNESKTVDKCPLLEGLTLPYYHRGYDCRMIGNGTKNTSFVDFPPNAIGKFDYLGLPCARDIVQIVNPVMINSHGYDLVIVMIGAWELKNECRILVAPLLESTLSSLLELNLNDVDDYEERMGGSTQHINTTVAPPEDLHRGQEQDKLLTPIQKWELLLKTLSNELSSPRIQVVIRTPGFSVKHNGDEDMWEMIRMSLQYFTTAEPRGGEKSRNVTIVDFGTMISARSYGDHRISGDSIYHYGLEARLLFGQQLLHELFAAELRETGELHSIIL